MFKPLLRRFRRYLREQYRFLSKQVKTDGYGSKDSKTGVLTNDSIKEDDLAP